MEVTDDSGAKVAMSSSVDMEGRVPCCHELLGDVSGVLDADAEDDGLFAGGESVVVVKAVSGDGRSIHMRCKRLCSEVASATLKARKIGLLGCIYGYLRERAKVDEFLSRRPYDETVEHIPKSLA